MNVILNEEEILEGAVVGCKRMATVMARNYKQYNGQPYKTMWADHIEGAMAERAAAKGLGLSWSALNGLNASDVGNKEVRHTTHDMGHLCIRERDKDAIYILATGQQGSYRLCGWVYARDVRVPEFWGNMGVANRPPAWFIPQSVLEPMETLPISDEERA